MSAPRRSVYHRSRVRPRGLASGRDSPAGEATIARFKGDLEGHGIETAGWFDHQLDIRAVPLRNRPVDVGVIEPEQLVDYRLGQANYSAWLDQLDPRQSEEIRGRLVEAIRPIMQPYRPIVVFLSALTG